MNIAQNVERGRHQFPNKPALVFEGQSLSYHELDEKSNRVANGLLNLGISRGDRVALFLPNIPPFIVAYLGIQKVGAVVVSINSALKTEEVKFILKDSGATAIVTTAIMRDNVPTADLPQLNSILIAEGEAKADIALSQLMADASPERQAVDMAQDDPAAILYTSGTTGFPKGVMLSHGNLITTARSSISTFRMQPEDKMLLCLPLFHSFGLTTVLNPCLEAGATLVLQREFFTEPVIEAIANQQITTFFGVPTLYITLYNQAKPDQMRSVHRYISGAATLPLEIGKQWHEKFGIIINELYGSTETSIICFNHPLKYKPGSVGSPLDGVEIKLVDAEGSEAAVGEVGEVTVRGSNVMLGYRNLPIETAEAIKDGWFRTGDIAKKDDEGYFFIVDRLKDMVNVGGIKVYPSEVENILYQHPAVVEAAVYGIKDTLMGEQVRASIVLKPDKTLTEEDMLAFCHERLAAFKVPSAVEFMDSLPKGKTGKILKRVLREKAQEQDLRDEQNAERSMLGDTADAALLSLDKEERKPFIEKKITETLSSVLPKQSAFETDSLFSDFGVDSISTMVIINKLNKALGIYLESTDLFNYPTIQQLTEQILEILDQALDYQEKAKIYAPVFSALINIKC